MKYFHIIANYLLINGRTGLPVGVNLNSRDVSDKLNELDLLLLTFINGSVQLLVHGSIVGRDSTCLMARIIFKNSAIPIAWFVGEGSKGHFDV